MNGKDDVLLIKRMAENYMIAYANLDFSPKTKEGKKEWLKHHDCLPEDLIFKGTKEQLRKDAAFIRHVIGGDE